MVLVKGRPEEVNMSPDRIRHVEELASRWVNNGITPAIVVFAARRGVIVTHRAFGKAGPEPDSPDLDIGAIFPLASLSKPITAACAMILAEDGLIDLYHPVSNYIPEFSGEGKDAVRIYHLMTHTSGLRDEDVHTNAEKKKDSAIIPPPESTQHPAVNRWLFLGYDTPLRQTPGSEMSYFNFGYLLLGEIVRRVSGKSLNEFACERIFRPLGMNDTGYIVPESKYGRVIRRKPLKDENIDWYSSPESLSTPWASGGAYSTAMDMAIFGQMFLNGGIYGNIRILSRPAVVQITQNQIPGVPGIYNEQFFPEGSWGYGWNVRGTKKDDCGSFRSARTISHGGAGGVRLLVDYEYELVSICFSVQVDQDVRDLFNNAITAAVFD